MTRQQAWMGFMATGLLLSTLVIVFLREPVLQDRAADAQLETAIETGTEIYLENCIICHGASGEGIGAYPDLSTATRMDEESLFKVIERGRFGTQMAPYGLEEGGMLSDVQIEGLVALIQYGNWIEVYAEAEARDLIPPEMVVAEIPEETITQVSALPNGDMLADALVLYAENCAACHGVQMEGTVLAPALASDEILGTESFELVRIIEEGVPGTLMASWDSALDDDAVDALVTLIYRWDEVQNAGIEIPVVEAEPLDMSTESIASGERLFNISCASCHGVGGYGSPLAPALNNDLFLDTTSDVQMRQIIAMGVTDTIMPAWGGRLSDTQINTIIAYLRSLAPNAPTITQAR